MTRRTRPPKDWTTQVSTYLNDGDWALAKWRLGSRDPAGEEYAALQARADASAMESTFASFRHRAQTGWWEMFTYRVDIRCPSCAQPGFLLPHHPLGARFTCPGCLSVGTPRRWRGKFTDRCSSCGQPLTRPERSGNAFVTHCGSCQARIDYPSSTAAGDPLTDGWLGLPLRYATQTRHGWLYAYNWQHLRELRAYVGATLRESPSANNNWANRLPGWITSAKNRAEITKALDKLLHDAQGPGT